MGYRERQGAWWTIAAWLLTAGCGSARQSVSPKADTMREPTPSTVEEAQSMLDRNEQRLRQVFPAGPGDSARPTVAPPSTSASVPPTPPSSAPPATAARQHEHPTAGAPAPDPASESRMTTPCEEACRALASMRRAADTICRLTRPDDDRCQSARRRVQQGEEQASSCGCPRSQGLEPPGPPGLAAGRAGGQNDETLRWGGSRGAASREPWSAALAAGVGPGAQPSVVVVVAAAAGASAEVEAAAAAGAPASTNSM